MGCFIDLLHYVSFENIYLALRCLNCDERLKYITCIQSICICENNKKNVQFKLRVTQFTTRVFDIVIMCNLVCLNEISYSELR